MGWVSAPRWLLPRRVTAWGDSYDDENKLATLFGPMLWPCLEGKSVIDFGCGMGVEAVEMLRHGARRVIGLDIQESRLAAARERAARAGFAGRCHFAGSTNERAQVIVSTDSFEHFAEPRQVLARMAELLEPGGEIWVSFGPTWYHPRGGHLFSFFPWSHLLFTERSLLAWRAQFRHDGARRFCEVAGGLNQMTIRRFEEDVSASPLQLLHLAAVPIRRLRWLHCGLTREYLSGMVQCRLAHRCAPAPASAQH
ncbi:MAG: class I SAM-dependent methyltransferase [Terriglobales bacterium]